MTPSERGARAEAEIAAALTRSGFDVFVPLFAAHSRIDLVAVKGPAVRRVQCKTARVRGEVIVFRTSSNTNNDPRDYRGDVDMFGVYSPDLDDVFLVPVDVVPARMAQLRLRPARNGQEKRIRWADPYRLAEPTRTN